MNKKIVIGIVLMFVSAAFLPNVSGVPPTEEDIEVSIDAGLAYLAGEQYGDGSWNNVYEPVASTAFVLIKLQERAIELGLDPFDPGEYEYADNIALGWNYIFNPLHWTYEPITDKEHGGNPDTNGNGHGLWFDTPGDPHCSTYTSGLVLMALAAGQDSSKLGTDIDGDESSETFGEIAQEIVDWFAWKQIDSNVVDYRGGWGYGIPLYFYHADNHNSGYAVFGLEAAKNFGCTIPGFVIDELNHWIDYIQNDIHGGSGYFWPNVWENILKTGILIFQMTFCGDDSSTPRFQNAMDYIETKWHLADITWGWGYSCPIPNFQAMYCLMKGLTYSCIDLLDLDEIEGPEHDWYEEFAEVINGTQNVDGSWPPDNWGGPSPILPTCWALLTLEKFTPPPPNLVEIDKYYTHADVNFNPWHYETAILFEEDFSDYLTKWTPKPTQAIIDNWDCSYTSIAGGTLSEACFNWYSNFDGNSWLKSPTFSTEGMDNVEVSYLQYVQHFAGSFNLQVQARNGLGIWTIVEDMCYTASSVPETKSIMLPEEFWDMPEVQIRFRFSGNSLNIDNWYIDDVVITGQYRRVDDPAELGTLLDSINMVIHEKTGYVKSTNPGQFFAVIDIIGPVQTFLFRDEFDREFDVNPSMIGAGGCQVIKLDPEGYAEVITDSDWVDIMEIDNDINNVSIMFDLPEPLPTDYMLKIYIKFRTVYKHEFYTGDDSFWDHARIDYDCIEGWDLWTGEVHLPITGID